MKKLILIGVLSCFLPAVCFSAEDDLTEGYKPLQPTGIFSVFSTRTLDTGKVTVEPGFEVVSDPDVRRLRLNLGYGIRDNADLGLSGSASETDEHQGFEDVAFGLRYRFLEEVMFGPSAALLVTLSLPLGDEDEGFGSGNLETEGLVAVSKRVGPFTGHANIGYNVVHVSEDMDELILAGGIEFSAARSLKLVAEFYGKTSRERDLYEVRFGYRSVLSSGLINTVGFGYGTNDRDIDYRLMILFSYAYPQREEQVIRVPSHEPAP